MRFAACHDGACLTQALFARVDFARHEIEALGKLAYFATKAGKTYVYNGIDPERLRPGAAHRTEIYLRPRRTAHMKLDPHDLDHIAAGTLGHYNQRAEDFREGTRDHDVSQNIAALLRHMEGEPPFTILDVGCGPGRDLKVFAGLGHVAIGLDGAERFVEMARADTGCEVWQQDFLKLDLPEARFDGIFANAALFHVPTQALPGVLRSLYAALKPGGVLFSSNPWGENQEGWNRGRYGAYHDLEAWRLHLSAAGFVELEHYYRPASLPREQQPWLATVWRRPRRPGPDVG